jgi:hypothetical protein
MDFENELYTNGEAQCHCLVTTMTKSFVIVICANEQDELVLKRSLPVYAGGIGYAGGKEPSDMVAVFVKEGLQCSTAQFPLSKPNVVIGKNSLQGHINNN